MDNLDIEIMLMRAWPSIEELTFDGWIIRSSGGYTKRANCVNPLYESYFDLEEKIEYCQKFYSEKKLPTIYKLMDSPIGNKVDIFLEEKGLKKEEIVSVQEIHIEDLNFEVNSIEVIWEFDMLWFDFFTEENKMDAKEKELLKEILLKNEENNFYVYKKYGEKIVAGALGVIEDENVCLFNLFVKEQYRGNGYGREVVEGVLTEARKINVKRAYLQVLANNDKAVKLYEKMGFVHKYSSWYRY